MKDYIRKFRRGSGTMSMDAIDYYEEDGKIIKHSWAMGGESKVIVDSAPIWIDGYEIECGKITKIEFENSYIKNSGITRSFYDDNFVTLYGGYGWACVSNDELSIKTHKNLYCQSK